MWAILYGVSCVVCRGAHIYIPIIPVHCVYETKTQNKINACEGYDGEWDNFSCAKVFGCFFFLLLFLAADFVRDVVADVVDTK